MAAYAALIKLQTRSLGPILTGRLSEVLEGLPAPMVYPWQPDREITLRTWILWRRVGLSSPHYDRDMPPDIRDTIARTALET